MKSGKKISEGLLQEKIPAEKITPFSIFTPSPQIINGRPLKGHSPCSQIARQGLNYQGNVQVGLFLASYVHGYLKATTPSMSITRFASSFDLLK